MLVDQKREHVLRIGFVQESKRQRLQRLLQQRQHIARVFAQGLLDQALGSIEATGIRHQGAGAALQEFRDDAFLIAPRDRVQLSDRDRNCFYITARQFGQQRRSIILFEAHQENGGLANAVGDCSVD